ncbi:MAG: hypothetical protein COV76_04425 [Candidatus Omnitrophica bacterium CG11_big_fil_rev_8_21_14_0_20_64_10]|nr:MAG: hypothetical protein COV76_04425 [Candidatus Omnitrophica bacterium CG11_big_fil_rev_8_21_14_0_20_64_10]
MEVVGMATEKQAKANQQNAQKSTGPKTEEGKEIVKLNAVKHGILSDAVVIPKGEGQERKEAYLRLYNGLWDYFKPDGAMEDTLVEQIAVTLWRKRRVLWFELGCLRKQLDDCRKTTEEPDEDEDEYASHIPKTARERLAAAKKRLAHHQQEKQYLQEGYDILSDEEVKNWADSYFKVAERKGFEAEEPKQVRDWLKEQGLTEDQIRQELTQTEEAAIEQAQAEIKTLEPQANGELERAALLASLPEHHWQLDKIIRYEASLDRQLYKAINQLERLQRSRKGETLPPPIVLDET